MRNSREFVQARVARKMKGEEEERRAEGGSRGCRWKGEQPDIRRVVMVMVVASEGKPERESEGRLVVGVGETGR